jgi:hypothetical protein
MLAPNRTPYHVRLRVLVFSARLRDGGRLLTRQLLWLAVSLPNSDNETKDHGERIKRVPLRGDEGSSLVKGPHGNDL